MMELTWAKEAFVTSEKSRTKMASTWTASRGQSGGGAAVVIVVVVAEAAAAEGGRMREHAYFICISNFTFIRREQAPL
jgi:hypothetical protein